VARRTKEDTERTYHALLDAAATLFTRQGVAKTTLEHIAAEAGVTRGAIYHRFDNKEMLVRALWERDGVALSDNLAKLAAQISASDPAGSFRVAVKGLLNNIVREPNLAQAIRIVIHNVEFTDEKTELQRYLANRKQSFLDAVEQAFEVLQKRQVLTTPLPPGLLAFSLLSYLYGLIHNHLTPDGVTLDLSEAGDDLVDLFLDGLLRG